MPEGSLEFVPVPQEEPRSKVAEPPKAHEPPSAIEPPRPGWVPKAKEPPAARKPRNTIEPPKANNPGLPKAEEPRPSLVPLQAAMSDWDYDKSRSLGCGPAALPEQDAKSRGSDEETTLITPISGCALRIVDPDGNGEDVAPAFANSLAILAPKKGDVFADIRQVVFRQEEDNRGQDRCDRQQDK
jgi:hypothetical protein